MKNDRPWPENERLFGETNSGDASAIFQDRLHAWFPPSGSSQPPDDSQTSPLTSVKTPHRLAWEV